MSELSGSHIDVPINEWFTIENHIMSTRTADLFKAYDRDLGRSIGLWLLRTPLHDGSPELKQNWERLQKMVANGVKTTTIYASGLDSQGILFCEIAAPDGSQVAVANLDVIEAERRFIAILKVIEYIHELGIVCGDISLSSFWMNRGGEVNLIGIMGGYEDLHGPVPPAETLYFLSPEERDAEHRKSTIAADIFSLGVLGYYLFTSRYPTVNNLLSTFPETGWAKPSQLVPTVPFWLDEVITKCLDPIPSRRYQKAKDILRSINEIKEKKIEEQSSLTSRTGTRAVQPKKDTESSMTTAATPIPEGTPETRVTPGGNYRILFAVGLAFLLFASAIAAVVLYLRPATQEESIGILKQAADDRMKIAIEVLNDQSAETQEKKFKFIELQNSDDPLAGDILLRAAQDAPDIKEKVLVEKSLLDRSKRLGLAHCVEVMDEWLKSIPVENNPPEYAAAFHAIDPTIPLDGRIDSLSTVASTNPSLTLNLAAAYVLDGMTPEDQKKLIPIIAPLSPYGDDDPSLSELLIPAKEIPMLIQEKLIPHLKEVTTESLLRFVDFAVTTVHPLRGIIVQMLSEDTSFSKLRSQYLLLIQQDSELPEAVPVVLLRAAYGKLTISDMQIFSQWITTSAEKVLLTLTIDNYESKMKKEAIEYLAGRGLNQRAAESFVKWLKRDHWEQREELAPIAGTIVYGDMLSDEDLKKKMEVFEKYVNDPELFNFVLASDQGKVVDRLLAQYAQYVPTAGLLRLLAHPSSKIRIEAIKNLKDRNDVTSLQAVIDLYNAERDEEVRKAYRENLWVIQQRIKS